MGCLLRSNCPTGRVVHPLKRPLPNVREGRGSWKKSSIFYFRRGHLSYLDTRGSTRGTQLMNMFVVMKFVINDCCLGSITSFFSPSRLFNVFIVTYLYIFFFLWREGMQLCKQLFFSLLCFLSGKIFVTWQKREVCFCFMMSLVTSRSVGCLCDIIIYTIIRCRRQWIIKPKSQEQFHF